MIDSLPDLINELGKNFKDYFLLFDEIDSIQEDSSYRDAMEIGMEFYKKHPRKNRAVLTSTPIGFSDPFFQNEAVSIFRRDTAYYKSISGVQTNEPVVALLNDLKHDIENNIYSTIPKVIALNDFKSIYFIIDELEKLGIESKNIALLCSSYRKKDHEKYYSELNEEKYPKLYNFITSAYFYGYDIVEDCHFKIVSDFRKRHCTLSTGHIKQIIGRLRSDSVDCKVYYNVMSNKEKDDLKLLKLTKDYLIKRAEALIKAEDCIKSIFKGYDDELETIVNYRENINKAIYPQYNRIVWNSSYGLKISYLNIDSLLAYIEALKTIHSENYNFQFGMVEDFIFGDKKILNIETDVKISDKRPLNENENLDLIELFNTIERSLIDLGYSNNLKKKLFKIRKENPQKSYFFLQILLKNWNVFEPVSFINEIKEATMKGNKVRRDIRKLNLLDIAFTMRLSLKGSELERHLKGDLRKGKYYDSNELLDIVKRCLVLSGLQSIDERSDKNLMSLCKNLFFLELNRTKNKYRFGGLRS